MSKSENILSITQFEIGEVIKHFFDIAEEYTCIIVYCTKEMKNREDIKKLNYLCEQLGIDIIFDTLY